MHPFEIAKICHEVNRAFCAALGDMSQTPWESAPQWQQESAVAGVNFLLNNAAATPQDSHESWLAEKQRTGWKYGPTKNVEALEHPCFVPYDDLPAAQRVKDHLFLSIVRGLAAV